LKNVYDFSNFTQLHHMFQHYTEFHEHLLTERSLYLLHDHITADLKAAVHRSGTHHPIN